MPLAKFHLYNGGKYRCGLLGLPLGRVGPAFRLQIFAADEKDFPTVACQCPIIGHIASSPGWGGPFAHVVPGAGGSSGKDSDMEFSSKGLYATRSMRCFNLTACFASLKLIDEAGIGFAYRLLAATGLY
jgi:hypothetical protein